MNTNDLQESEPCAMCEAIVTPINSHTPSSNFLGMTVFFCSDQCHLTWHKEMSEGLMIAVLDKVSDPKAIHQFLELLLE